MAREQRALQIIRQQQEESSLQDQRSTASSPIVAGVNVLRDYANRFSDAFTPYEPPPFDDTEKLQLLLKQLGLSPGLAGGLAATLIVGGFVTAMKRIVDEAEESNDKSGLEEKGIDSNPSEEDTLSSQVANLLEKKREEKAQVRKTIRISIEEAKAMNNQQKIQSSESPSASSTGSTLESQPSPSIKFGERSRQQNTVSPAGNRKSSAFNPPSKNANSSPESSPPKKSSTSGGLPNFGVSPPKNASLTEEKTPGSPTSFGSPPQKPAGLNSKEGSSPFGSKPKQAVPRKQAPSPFGTSPQKEGSFNAYGSPPPKFSKPKTDVTSPFGTAPKQSALKEQSISPFGTSVPKSIESSGKKEGSIFGASGKQGAFGISKKEQFSSETKSAESLEPPTQKFGGSSVKKFESPFGTTSKQDASKNQPAAPFSTVPPKAGLSKNAFGSPPNSAESTNTGEYRPRKSIGSSGDQVNPSIGAPPKQFVPGKQPASPFVVSPKSGPSSTFGSPTPNVVRQPLKKIASPFTTTSNPNVPKRETASPFNNNSFGIPPKQGTMGDEMKKPFNPFSQRNQSLNKSKPSFSSAGPVYMPPTPKTKNDESLNDVYSSLDRKQKNYSDDSPEKRDTSITSGPKKSFSPFGGANEVMKPTSVDSFPNTIPSAPSTILGTPADMNNPRSTVGITPGSSAQGSKNSISTYGSKQVISAPKPESASLGSTSTSALSTVQGQGIKKSYSPFGRKPKQGANNPPKVDPSSFSFGAPPSQPSLQQNSASPESITSFSREPGETSSAGMTSSPSTNVSVFQGGSDESNKMESVSQPFAATGFPLRDKKFDGGQKGENSGIERDRMTDSENATKESDESYP